MKLVRSDGAHPDAFNLVTGMEGDLDESLQMATAIAILAETLDDVAALPIQRIAWRICNCVNAAAEKRGKLFRLTHPNRTEFEQKGWPSDAVQS